MWQSILQLEVHVRCIRCVNSFVEFTLSVSVHGCVCVCFWCFCLCMCVCVCVLCACVFVFASVYLCVHCACVGAKNDTLWSHGVSFWSPWSPHYQCPVAQPPFKAFLSSPLHPFQSFQPSRHLGVTTIIITRNLQSLLYMSRSRSDSDVILMWPWWVMIEVDGS